MPQELHVLRCYSCQAFQVHIVKKSTKWECKLCGEKQSIQKVYGKGSGKECRLYVQELNQRRLESTQQPFVDITDTTDNSEKGTLDNVAINNIKPNRWAEFIPSTATITTDSDEEIDSSKHPNYTFDQPIKKRKNKCLKISENSTGDVPSNTVNSDKEKYNKTPNYKCKPIKKRKNTKIIKDSFSIEEQKLHTFCTSEKERNDNIPISREPLKTELQLDIDKQPHSKRNELSKNINNKTCINLKSSSRWVEFLTTKDDLSEDETVNDGNAVENSKCFQEIRNTNGISSASNTDTHIHDCKSNISCFPRISKVQDEIKGDQLKQRNCTNLSSTCTKSLLDDDRFQCKLFNNGDENNLDEIFTFS